MMEDADDHGKPQSTLYMFKLLKRPKDRLAMNVLCSAGRIK